jgi:IS5 family transposase
MGYKKMKQNLGFADLALASSLEHNRSIKLMEKISDSIDWKRIESVLMSHYTVGTSGEGADAYLPLLLFKCLMLQKWFHINSDPELENQINDRLSFKKFLQLPFDKPSPDHSTFSRFRTRLSKEAMDELNSEILHQFENQGLTINEGVAIDARLVKSASRPLSNDQLKKVREQRDTPEGKLDKNGNTRKFSRDLDSDWVVQKDDPHYGLKEHASVDTNHGFVLATTMTPASVNDTNLLPYCTVYSRHTEQPIEIVFADKGYAGKPNRDFLALNEISDGIMRKDSTTAKFTQLNMFEEHLLRNLTGRAKYEKERNKRISKVRYIVEQYFGISHLHDKAKRARFTTIAKNNFDAWCRQAAYNIRKGLRVLKVATV